MARIVVTGGAGFIGSSLSRKLVSDGHEVVVFDNAAVGTVLKEVEAITGDILDPAGLAAALKDAEYVFHNAAIRSIPRSMRDPVLTSRANIMGTMNVLEAAKDCGAKKVVLASSSSVYGAAAPLPLSESISTDPQSFYAVAKALNEKHAQLYHRNYGLETVCLSYFNVFGPGQDGKSEFSPVIPKFIDAMKSGRRPVIFGDGKQSRDFTYIDNVVHANMLAMSAGREASGMAFNVAQGESHSLNEVVGLLNGFLRTDLQPAYQSGRDQDVRDTRADLSLSGKLLGYRPIVQFEEGLRRTSEFSG